MSWLDEIKLAVWGVNDAAATKRVSGINFRESGIGVADNPNALTTMPNGQVVQGRTELTVNAPAPNMVWFAQAAPAVAADRWLSNYGVWSGVDHCKCNTVAWRATRLSFMCTGGMPANDIVVMLYLNLNPQAAWTMTLNAGAGPTYKNSVAIPGGILVGNGGLVGIRCTQAGTDPRPNWNASFSLT